MILKEMSHALVFFNSVEGVKQSGIIAIVKLCFGSDDDAVGQIMLQLTPGIATPVWQLPTRQRANGDMEHKGFPIFQGQVGKQILDAAAKAAERVKKDMAAGKIEGKYEKRMFRVTKTTVEEIFREESVSAK